MVTRAAAIVVDKKMIRYTFTSAVAAAAAAGDGGGGGGGCASASALLSPSSLSLTDTLSAYLRVSVSLHSLPFSSSYDSLSTGSVND